MCEILSVIPSTTLISSVHKQTLPESYVFLGHCTETLVETRMLGPDLSSVRAAGVFSLAPYKFSLLNLDGTILEGNFRFQSFV